MAKRLSEKQKKEITNRFKIGEKVDILSKDYNCTNTTITRNLKKSLGETKYKELLFKSKSSTQSIEKNNQNITGIEDLKINKDKKIDKNNDFNIKNNTQEEFFEATPFMEITPLNYEIENSTKDLSSIPIIEVDFPKTVFMIVDKIELEIKYLKDYPDWQFLSQEELNRKTIEILTI